MYTYLPLAQGDNTDLHKGDLVALNRKPCSSPESQTTDVHRLQCSEWSWNASVDISEVCEQPVVPNFPVVDIDECHNVYLYSFVNAGNEDRRSRINAYDANGVEGYRGRLNRYDSYGVTSYDTSGNVRWVITADTENSEQGDPTDIAPGHLVVGSNGGYMTGISWNTEGGVIFYDKQGNRISLPEYRDPSGTLDDLVSYIFVAKFTADGTWDKVSYFGYRPLYSMKFPRLAAGCQNQYLTVLYNPNNDNQYYFQNSDGSSENGMVQNGLSNQAQLVACLSDSGFWAWNDTLPYIDFVPPTENIPDLNTDYLPSVAVSGEQVYASNLIRMDCSQDPCDSYTFRLINQDGTDSNLGDSNSYSFNGFTHRFVAGAMVVPSGNWKWSVQIVPEREEETRLLSQNIVTDSQGYLNIALRYLNLSDATELSFYIQDRDPSDGNDIFDYQKVTIPVQEGSNAGVLLLQTDVHGNLLWVNLVQYSDMVSSDPPTSGAPFSQVGLASKSCTECAGPNPFHLSWKYQNGTDFFLYRPVQFTSPDDMNTPILAEDFQLKDSLSSTYSNGIQQILLSGQGEFQLCQRTSIQSDEEMLDFPSVASDSQGNSALTGHVSGTSTISSFHNLSTMQSGTYPGSKQHLVLGYQSNEPISEKVIGVVQDPEPIAPGEPVTDLRFCGSVCIPSKINELDPVSGPALSIPRRDPCPNGQCGAQSCGSVSTVMVPEDLKLCGKVGKICVALQNLKAIHLDDLELLLVGPNGIGAWLLWHVGGCQAICCPELTICSDAVQTIPKDMVPVCGEIYLPSDGGCTPTWSGSQSVYLPSGQEGTDLSIFCCLEAECIPGSKWSLVAVNRGGGDISIGGWELQLTMEERLLAGEEYYLECLPPVCLSTSRCDRLGCPQRCFGTATSSDTLILSKSGGLATGNVVKACSSFVDETLTSLAATSTGLIYYDEDGNSTSLDLCPVVNECQTLTSLAGTSTGLVYYDENGDSTSLDLCPIVEECLTAYETTMAMSSGAYVTSFTLTATKVGRFVHLMITGGNTTTATATTDLTLSGIIPVIYRPTITTTMTAPALFDDGGNIISAAAVFNANGNVTIGLDISGLDPFQNGTDYTLYAPITVSYQVAS